MDPRFSEIVTAETELRALIGHPSEAVVKSRLAALDKFTGKDDQAWRQGAGDEKNK